MIRRLVTALFLALAFAWPMSSARAACDYDVGGSSPFLMTTFEAQLDEEFGCIGTILGGLDVGSDVQAYDADLVTWAGVTSSANGRSLVSAADYSAMRTLLGLVIGVNVQAFDSDLSTWAGLTPSANFQTLVTQTFAQMRASLDLEAGTDFYSIAAANAAFQPIDSDLTTWAGVTPSANGQSLVSAANYAAMTALLPAVVGDSGAGGTKGLVPTPGSGDTAAGKFLKADGTWALPPGAGGGEANTASNVGTAGVGVFKQKSALDLQFKKINAGSGGKVTITDDTGNDEVDINVPDASTTQAGACELATSAESEGGSDTVRCNTPAGLLAAFSGQKTISIPGGAILAATTAGCTAAQLESATNKINQKICGFTSTAADEYGWFQIAMPKGWDEGTITGQFLWTSASGTGDVVWSLACLARSDDDAMDTALGTAVTVTDTQLTAGDLMISAATSAVTIGGTPAEGDEIFCRVARVGTNGSDTFSGTAQLSAVKVLYSINAMTDD